MMNARWLASWGLRGVLAAALVGGALTGIAPGVASASSCAGWNGQQPPSPSAGTTLFGVAVPAPCDVWVAGTYFDSATQGQTLIEHWTGTAWKRVASPDPGGRTDDNRLFALSFTSRTNGWAVGSTGGNTTGGNLILHWNGTAWKAVRNPVVSGALQLDGVAATSSRNAWAVGYRFCCKAEYRPVIEHWTGTAWKLVPSPRINGQLLGVTATSSRNAWAVGSTNTGTATDGLIEHWNGRAWKRVPSPNHNDVTLLNAVAATSSSNAWAVGNTVTGLLGNDQPSFVLHWNGTAWRHVPSPNTPHNFFNDLTGVAATSGANAWAVGEFSNRKRDGTLIEHWNGTSWKLMPSQGLGDLNAVATAFRSGVWAAGIRGSGVLVVHWR